MDKSRGTFLAQQIPSGPGYARCIHCERVLQWRLFKDALRVPGMSVIVPRFESKTSLGFRRHSINGPMRPNWPEKQNLPRSLGSTLHAKHNYGIGSQTPSIVTGVRFCPQNPPTSKSVSCSNFDVGTTFKTVRTVVLRKRFGR